MHYYLHKIDASHSITKKIFLLHTGELHSTRLDHIKPCLCSSSAYGPFGWPGDRGSSQMLPHFSLSAGSCTRYHHLHYPHSLGSYWSAAQGKCCLIMNILKYKDRKWLVSIRTKFYTLICLQLWLVHCQAFLTRIFCIGLSRYCLSPRLLAKT